MAFNSEVNGRWNPEAAQFVHELANEKKKHEPPQETLETHGGASLVSQMDIDAHYGGAAGFRGKSIGIAFGGKRRR